MMLPEELMPWDSKLVRLTLDSTEQFVAVQVDVAEFRGPSE